MAIEPPIRAGDRMCGTTSSCQPTSSGSVNERATPSLSTSRGGGTITGNTITANWIITGNTPAFAATANHH
ncbi:MAG: hypothetical protein M3O28_05155 [Actinomycetota bacterium]|nr:hypothetical protein [Actinomycetota bacterium]